MAGNNYDKSVVNYVEAGKYDAVRFKYAGNSYGEMQSGKTLYQLLQKQVGDAIVKEYAEETLEIPETEETEDVEVYVCPDVARREARKRGLPYSREVTLYMAHGLLHAAGEDDLVPEKKRRMRRREKQVLAALENNCNFERIFGS